MDVINLWQIWCIAGLILVIIEIFTPAMFFMNLGIACFFAAISAFFGLSLLWQVIVFGIFSTIFLIWLRPILMKNLRSNKTETVEMYIGKTATVVEKVTQQGGRISLFGEEWQAKSINDEVFEVGSEVRIVKNDSIILFVENISK